MLYIMVAKKSRSYFGGNNCQFLLNDFVLLYNLNRISKIHFLGDICYY